MNIIERAKNILLTPKTEWEVINGEDTTPMALLTTYVLPMALIGAVASFIGYGFIGLSMFGIKIVGIKWGIVEAVTVFVGAILTYFICTYVVDALAPSFNSEKDINKSAQLVAYATTASAVGAAFKIIPSLSILGVLVSLYSVYLFYLGLEPLKKTPEDKKIVFMIVCALVVIVCSLVIGTILTKIIYTFTGNPYQADINKLLGV
jgi:Yip1 domain